MKAWPERAQVIFRLHRDDTGYPPSDWESLWGFRIGAGVYEIENVPFYVRDISLGDHVAVSAVGDELHFLSILLKSTHSTVRVAIKDSSQIEKVRSQLMSLGYDGEFDSRTNVLALDVPRQNAERLFQYLDDGYRSGVLDFEEASVRYR